ncbi:hypothetical protein [Paenibacillus mucilaginosus]|nr:hypothetical protein [Paenibacillus mucilaginosus]AEI42088.1 hypothetical protein KNP414_03544 [Paenibacillus mucilaginosus KNP414]AFH60053.1 hypothetical protein B2K_04840 [Paenibacillus mucilaginosus K02]MCG7214075.1 hypothetical protein [Paenibacillus mucilaginosus]WDM28598.1 hypothetical protein KCX80_05075 [Paenibacillus mucilaginosus]WFA16764.1 hypothetical protein ERY13_05120 [Paenibacillus mucilaginosus]
MTGAAVIKEKEQPEMRWTFGAKTEVLKRYEGYAYQVVFYLLQREEDALAAAQEVLLELYGCDEFYRAAPEEQQKRVKAAAMRHALKALGRRTAAGAKEPDRGE